MFGRYVFQLYLILALDVFVKGTGNSMHSNCTIDEHLIDRIGDGLCDSVSNIKDCGWDGGDCCVCTCKGEPCQSDPSNNFNCLDPGAPREIDGCLEWPSDSPPFECNKTETWTVNSRAQARALADALDNCTGEAIEVTWEGHVVIEKPFSLTANTRLRVTGVGSNASMDGGGTIGLFVVSNSSLIVSNIMLVNGNSISGGAIAAQGSNVSLHDTVFDGNIAGFDGGAIFVTRGCNVYSSGASIFLNNTAARRGGAVSAKGQSDAVWTGWTNFSKNNAWYGGAVDISFSSYASWEASTSFLENSARKGGGVSLIGGSTVSWMGDTTFENNSATGPLDRRGDAGALRLEEKGAGYLEGDTTFMDNTAGIDGGALLVTENSTALWKGNATFICNTASGVGGALSIMNHSSVAWLSSALFSTNSAEAGGALIAAGGSRVKLSGETIFKANKARLDGGAIGAYFLSSSEELSTIEINGRSVFERNSCGSSGGALVLSESLSVSGNLTDITFLENSADVYGGAVYILSMRVGPVFKRARFESNRAQSGGGVYAVSSGTAVSTNPVRDKGSISTFDNCLFINNEAKATGGAMSSASGQDLFYSSTFISNSARFGGALQLAGTASIDSCVFKGNTADLGGGPAVSNIGGTVNVASSTFIDNIFNCGVGSFLDLKEGRPEDIHMAICEGCEVCDRCDFGDMLVPECVELLKHAQSKEGNTTIEKLQIDKGYWRATANSKDILKCYNSDACKGGVTGAPDYCHPGYMGPYCSICNEDYAASLNHVCSPCIARTWGLIIVVVVGILGLLVATMVVSYLVSADLTGRGMVNRMAQIIPFQSTKSIIVVWQIVTQFASVIKITFPRIYQRFLSAVDVFNFDLTWIPSAVCVLDFDFHKRFLIATIGPVVTMALLGITYAFATLTQCRSDSTLQNLQLKHVSALLLVTFLVYSNVSSMIFKMFVCDALDDGKIYLRADYRIECDSAAHKSLQIYAGFMILLYPVGIPLLYAWLLFKDRHVLGKVTVRDVSVRAKPTSDLWKPYMPERFCYEVVECLRRVSLAGAVIFIYPNTTSQIEVTLVMAFVFTLGSEWLAPYNSGWNCWISRIGHVIVCMNMYIALMFDVDGSGKLVNSQRLFEMALVAANVGVVLVVLVEATGMTCSEVTHEQDGPRPRPMNIYQRSLRRFRKEKVYGVPTFHGVEARVYAGE